MSLTLKKALEIYPFSNVNILVGNNMLDREITSINIIEVPTVSLWMKGGELLFTSGYAFNGDIDFVCNVLEELAEKNIAGLVIKPSIYLNHIAHQIVSCAQRLGIPLFQMPTDMGYMDVAQPIMEYLINENILVLKHLEDVHNRLISVFLSHGNLQNISEQLSLLVRSQIWLADTQGRLIAGSQNNPQAADEFFENLLHVYGADIAAFEQQPSFRCFRFIGPDGKEAPYVIVPIDVDGQRTVYLIMEYQHKEAVQNYDSMVLEHASIMYALFLQQQAALLEKEWQLKSECLDDLIWNNCHDNPTIINRAMRLGVDLSQPFIIASIGYTSNTVSNNIASEICTAPPFQKPIRQIANNAGMNILIYNRGECITFLTTVKRSSKMSYLKKVLNNMIQALEGSFPENKFWIGVSKTYDSIADVKTAYQESITAIRCGQSANGRLGNRIIFFESLGVFRFLGELHDSPAMRDFYEQHFNALVQYDTEKGGNLIHTLKVYFNCNCNIRKTADILFLHNNSIVYRLHKIEQLSGHSLHNAEDVFQLQLCLKLQSIL